MTSMSIWRCKKGNHVILRFEENLSNASGRLELLASINTMRICSAEILISIEFKTTGMLLCWMIHYMWVNFNLSTPSLPFTP